MLSDQERKEFKRLLLPFGSLPAKVGPGLWRRLLSMREWNDSSEQGKEDNESGHTKIIRMPSEDFPESIANQNHRGDWVVIVMMEARSGRKMPNAWQARMAGMIFHHVFVVRDGFVLGGHFTWRSDH
jgi:hypothetical protein